METVEYQNIANNERSHFYYAAVRDLVLGLVTKYVLSSSKSRIKILDAGCGTGWLSSDLSRYGHVCAIDTSEEALKFTREKGVEAKFGSIEKMPIESASIDLVVSIDVIYHKNVADDRAAVSELERVLKPGGWLVMRVPANMELYSEHDRLVETARRYSKGEVRNLLKNAGLQTVLLGACQSFLYVPALIKAFTQRGRAQTSPRSAVDDTLHPFVNWALTKCLCAENKLLFSGAVLPKGLGIIAVARKSQ